MGKKPVLGAGIRRNRHAFAERAAAPRMPRSVLACRIEQQSAKPSISADLARWPEPAIL